MLDTVTLEPEPAEAEVSETLCSWIGGIVVHLGPIPQLNREQLVEFCQANGDLRIEQTAGGELIIMLPVNSEGGFREAELIADFVVWVRGRGNGKVFGPSAGFTLPNGAMRSPRCVVGEARNSWTN